MSEVSLETYQIYVNGEWADAQSGKSFLSSEPYTGKAWAEIPEGDEALVSPGEASEAAMSAANAPAGSVPGSRRNLSFSLNSGRSLGGRSVVSELSEASAMSVSPRSHFGMEDDAEEGGRGGHSDVPHLNLALSAPLPSK